MKELKALVLMQFKDKINWKYTNKKALFTKVLFELLKVIIVGGIAYVFYFICTLFSIFSMYNKIPLSVMTIILTFILFISVISCTSGLMNSLYTADDNKVLITFPLSGNKIFLSKIIVFLFNELKRNFTFSLPIFLAYGVFTGLSFVFYLRAFIAFIVLSALPVLIGALLSIPLFYIVRFLNRFYIIKYFLILALIGFLLYGAIVLINMIPEEFNMIYAWPTIYRVIQEVLNYFQFTLFPLYFLTIMIIGKPESLSFTYINLEGWATFGILIGILIILFLVIYYGVKKYYIRMTSLTFEYAKKETIKEKKNKVYSKRATFFHKEFIDISRSGNYISSFLSAYIIIPIIILLLTRIFSALVIRYYGSMLSWVFTIMFILLSILSANIGITSIFSREGRAAIMNRTLPTKPIFPLLNKLIIFIVLSIVVAISSLVIFQLYANLDYGVITLIGLGIIFLIVGMIFFGAFLDLKNPQNDQYATNGGDFVNPNEISYVVVSFIVSLIYTFYSYILLNENSGNFIVAAIKLFLIGLLVLLVCLSLFIKYVKAFYFDSTEGKR